MSERHEHWKFRPHPFLRSGHLQTIAGIYLPRKDEPYAATQHYVHADDLPPEQGGDQLVLHEDRPDAWQPGAPVVLLIHGFAGCYSSTYMTRMMQRMTSRGYCVFRMDMRGCGAGEELARQPTHCGRWLDVAKVLRHLADIYPESPALAVGFSLGGSQLLNMLANFGDERIGNFERGMAICPPIDLFDVEKRFNTRGGRPYDKFFVRLIWRQVVERWKRFPDLAPSVIPRRPKRLGHIDEMVIAPAAGYANRQDYYRESQVAERLALITQPVTIIAAEDDPIVPTAPLRQYKHGPGVEAVYVPGGGHLGFIARSNGDPDYRWLDWRIIDWAEQSKNRNARERSESSAAR